MHALLLATLLNTGEIDRAIRLEMRVERIAGLSIGIARDGRTVFARGYGRSNLSNNTAARIETIYRIGSLTKPFTAFAIEQLAAHGKLSLQDPIAKYVSAPWTGVTIEDLLLHRSGIPSYSDLTTLDEHKDYSPEELVGAVAGMPLQFMPGTQFAYSNTNYVLLGEIVERVANEPFPEYLQNAVLTPLRLHDTSYGDRSGEARGYARNTLLTPVAPSSVSYGYAAAGMSSNVPDLLKWLASAREPYFGYFAAQVYGHPVRYATGTVPGYSSYEAVLPNTAERIVILTNADTLDLAPLAEDVLLALEPPTSEYRVRALVEQLQAATLLRSSLTDHYNATLTNAQMQAWRAELAPLGAVQNVERLGTGPQNGCTHERFRVTFTSGSSVAVDLCMTASGAIDSIAISPQ
jgi:CubicO group peptidase (beta-lactamase class C family)